MPTIRKLTIELKLIQLLQNKSEPCNKKKAVPFWETFLGFHALKNYCVHQCRNFTQYNKFVFYSICSTHTVYTKPEGSSDTGGLRNILQTLDNDHLWLVTTKRHNWYLYIKSFIKSFRVEDYEQDKVKLFKNYSIFTQVM